MNNDVRARSRHQVAQSPTGESTSTKASNSPMITTPNTTRKSQKSGRKMRCWIASVVLMLRSSRAGVSPVRTPLIGEYMNA